MDGADPTGATDSKGSTGPLESVDVLEAPTTLHIPIDHHSAVQTAASRARALAHACGMPGALPDQAAVLASELASNISKHARNGALFLQPSPLGRRSPLDTALDVVAVDHGPGIADIGLSLTDGFSTTRTMGAGLGAVRRIATDFTLRSTPGLGTLAHARLALPGGRRPGAAIGALCLPATGEQVCGDGYAVAEEGGTWTGLVIDGLGHGPEAAAASRRAVRTFLSCSNAPLPQVINALHSSLRHTRGAAATAVRMGAERAEFCGVGNIRAAALSAHGVHRQLTGQAGIVGYNLPTPRSRFLDVSDCTAVVLYTDGIDQRWTQDPTADRLSLPPALLAASLVHTHRRHRDDATVLALGSPLELR
ncbi:SpoIIE family protein phosphatase [Streptomyces sp. NPDC023327]|uniref:SpoIIE family protein phosphatase n=1 Tax=Streptomyces sp. NPDC023327 TaxID=3157088 RepID=UPI0033E1A6EB